MPAASGPPHPLLCECTRWTAAP